MECRRLQDWLESVDSCQIADVPLHILAHSRDCGECGNILDNLKHLETEHNSLVFPLPEILTLKNRVQEAIQPSPIPYSHDSLNFFTRWGIPTWTWAFTGIVLIWTVGIWIFQPGFFSSGKTYSIAIAGKDGIVTFNQNETLMLKDFKDRIRPGSLLVLQKSASYATVTFSGEGKIDFLGTGKIRIQENGFGTRDGNFQARFHKGKQEFVANIPGAVLGIRGTVIAFDFREPEKIFLAELLEGAVEVRPTRPGMPAFPWNAGEKLIAGDSGVSISASTTERVMPQKGAKNAKTMVNDRLMGPASETLLTPDAIRDPETPIQMNGSQTW